MSCPSCGFENREGMNFCGKCGRLLKPRCLQCNFENPASFVFWFTEGCDTQDLKDAKALWEERSERISTSE